MPEAQTIDIEPEGPRPERVPSPSRRNTTDSLIESVLDSLGPDNDNGTKPAEEPRAKRGAPERDEQQSEVEQPVPSETEPDDAEGEPKSAEEPEESDGHGKLGSKEDPFTVKDLPKDAFIELKVDGEKLTVSMDELAAGYIREATFNQRINKTKQLADEAQAALGKAKETQQKTRDAFREFVSDPEQLYEFFLASEDREQILQDVAVRYAALVRKFRENPAEKLAFQRQRDVQRLNAEREHFEAQKRAEMEEKQRNEMVQRAQSIFRPGWEAGLRKAGFPQPTKELYEEVMVRCNQRAATGAPVTSDDVTDFVVRAAKLLELPPASARGKPKPAPAAPPKPKPEAARKSAWADVPVSKKRRDPEFFLQNLKSRDFR
jgi:hypothetical protein